MAALSKLAVAALSTWILARLRRKRRRTRRYYVRLINLKRPLEGAFSTLVNQMRKSCDQDHFSYFRMSKDRFDELLGLVYHRILHASTHKMPISPAERLAITLRYLASGDSLHSLAYSYRADHSTLSNIVHETTSAIWDELSGDYMKSPDLAQWLQISQRFWDQWQFPLCLGAIDGKHVAIKNPSNAGSQFYNYKRYFSLVLLAVADADYRFTYVDIGGAGREGDAGLFHSSSFGKRVECATLDLDRGGLDVPADAFMPSSAIKAPHIFLGDAAFPIQRHIIKPYAYQTASGAESIFNYRVSRARRVVENTFGILVARWRILQTRMELNVQHAENVVKACVALHNFLKAKDSTDTESPAYVPVGYTDYENDQGEVVLGGWRAETDHGYALTAWEGDRSHKRTPYAVREKFKHYFLSPEGSVPWQDEYAKRGEY